MAARRVAYRPLVRSGAVRSAGACALAGGPLWFDRVVRHSYDAPADCVAAGDLDAAVRARLAAPRARACGLDLARPRVMGIVNVTPDSFSDGGLYRDAGAAVAHGLALVAAGADVLDIGGESTRPGAGEVPEAEEVARVVPVIAGLRAAGVSAPISVDTRKAGVAEAALAAGADMVNDVSAFSFEPKLADVVARSGVPVCLMHARGQPETMQRAPRYDDVLLDVFFALEARIAQAEAAGIARERIIVDPGIGFGKTLEHNLALIRGLSVFHDLGCAVLLGVSRKRFIGALSGVEVAGARAPGSIAAGLAGVAQGAQILRVHDVGETCQALAVWQGIWGEDGAG